MRDAATSAVLTARNAGNRPFRARAPVRAAVLVQVSNSQAATSAARIWGLFSPVMLLMLSTSLALLARSEPGLCFGGPMLQHRSSDVSGRETQRAAIPNSDCCCACRGCADACCASRVRANVARTYAQSLAGLVGTARLPSITVAKVTQWVGKPTRARPSLARDLLSVTPRVTTRPLCPAGSMNILFRLISACLWHLPLASAKIKCQQQVPLVWARRWGPSGRFLLPSLLPQLTSE